MFWDIFYKICIEQGTKPNPVAKQIGVSSSTVTSWKNGGIPNGETLLKLADYLNVSVDYLLGREKNPTNINTANNSKIDNSTVIGVSAEKQYDETTNQVAEMFSNMSIKNKAKVLSLMVELNDEEGA